MRETIQISLGPSANAITAHVLNVQGLAATDDDTTAAVCEAETTHLVEGNVWVPRCIMIDEPTRFPATTTSGGIPRLQSTVESNASSTWLPSTGGRIETVDSIWSLNPPVVALGSYWETASALAYNSHSRYSSKGSSSSSKRASFKTSSQNSRHVVWEDNEEEPDEEEEDPDQRAMRREQEQKAWQTTTKLPLQQKLSDLWKETTDQQRSALSWTDYLMPPYSERSKVPLPFSTRSNMISNWDNYISSHSLDTVRQWTEEALAEQVRHMLEKCDSCQGVTITTEGYGIYAGLTTSLLEEFQEECKSAGRLVLHVTNPQTTPDPAWEDTDPASSKENNSDQASSNWQQANVQRVRRQIQSGLVLHGFTQAAHLVVPLRLEEPPNGGPYTLFTASARVAMALESATLPYRFRGNESSSNRYTIGMQNTPFYGQGGGDTRWGTTAQRLSFGEFLSCLQPSSQYSLVELDTLGSSHFSTSDGFWENLKVGTSVERDQRMREDGRDSSRYRPQDVLPGGWMQHAPQGGILSSLSLEDSDQRMMDRSLHHHFALSTLVRTTLPNSLMRMDDPSTHHTLSKYMTCLVESMGIRYRPERSMGAVLNQSLGSLTFEGYGAGAYWESLVPNTEIPVVAVLGNTTRIYPYLNELSTGMKQALEQRYRGYYNRDVVNGVLPEAEDCEESLASCFDIRDLYHPPTGSGLVPTEEPDEDF